MPSSFNHWLDLALPYALKLLGIFVVALVLNRLLRALTNLVIKRASAQTRPAQLREQQTRTLAGILYSTGSKIVWVGEQTLIRDLIMGFYIVLEDQYVVGDTVQSAENIGRVEHLTLRRTVIRDPRGALITIA